MSGCLDGKLRVWNTSDKKVVLWNELANTNQSSANFITAISFCQGGRTIAVGTYDGKCILYQTEVSPPLWMSSNQSYSFICWIVWSLFSSVVFLQHLKYYSLINIRSTRRRYAKGSKITGIEVLNNDENKVSNLKFKEISTSITKLNELTCFSN